MAAVLMLAVRHPQRRRRVPVLVLSTLWVLVGVLVIDLIAARLGWWEYIGPWPRFGGTPIDLLLVWALLWGALPVLVLDRVRPLKLVALFGMIDLITMPALDGHVVALGRWWMIGEGLLLALVAFPALFLADVTLRRSRRSIRVALQMTLFGGVLSVLAPMLAVHLSGVPFQVPDRSWVGWSALVHLAVIPAVMAISAVLDLHRIGNGTPYPWDPTSRVVSVGPYAYLSNPMQTGGSILVAIAALAMSYPPMILAAGFTILFSVTLAQPHEAHDLAARWASEWKRYRRSHRSWIPTWRPRITGADAIVHIDMGCEVCSSFATFLVSRRPVALEVRDARASPGPPLQRLTYEIDGYRCDGIEAAARAFEHVHLGWAALAWIVRAPGVAWLAQHVGDVVGFGPRPAGGEACDAVTWTRGPAPRGKL